MATFKLLAVGDSNTIGPTPPVAWSTWAPRVLAAVQAALPSDTITLTNNAAGSTASYDLYANRATLIEDESPTIVIVAMGGTNDAYYDDPANGYPRGDGQDYGAVSWRSRMNAIVAGALTLTDASSRPTRVIVCSAPPAHPQSYPGSLSWRDPVRLEAIRDQAADLVSDLADLRVQFVDLWTEMQTPSWETAMLDTADGGVHLSDAGQDAAAGLILPAVLSALEFAFPLVLEADAEWQQVGSAITVVAPLGTRTVTQATTVGPGGLVRFRGTDAASFEVSSDGVSWSHVLTVAAGAVPIYLGVTPAHAGTLTAEVGVPI